LGTIEKMTSWRDLEALLDAAAGRASPIRFWWRDDDVGIDHPDFARLLELAARWSLPVALSVVPLRLAEATQAQIRGSAEATVLQHGLCHRNYAPPGEQQSELGWRDPDRIVQELIWGRMILENAFGTAFLAVLAPPWNRLDPCLLDRLPDCGFIGLSTSGRRRAAVPGLVQVNVHVDVVDWPHSRPGDRRFVGEGSALAQLGALMSADEPIGILTHHRHSDEAVWQFLARLLALLAGHPGAELHRAAELFVASPQPIPPPSISRR
jgi:peptidoglycan/xylan/chitin deacetylase (PgdA/CDA1 family)